MIDAPTATLIASVLATAVAIVGFVAVVYHKLGKLEGKLEGEVGRLEEKLDQGLSANRELILAESRRLSDKMDADYARLSDKMDADYARLSDKMDVQHAETMAAIQRLMEAFLSHSHDDDGNVIFRIPPGGGPD